MSRILIIPDLHQQINAGEIMLCEGLQLDPDRVVFLGDLFDDFYDKPEDSAKTALWFKKWRDRLGDKLVTLYGNHDLPYAEAAHYLEKHGSFPPEYKPAFRCSGFDTDKARAIHEAVGLGFWSAWKLHHREDGVLFTHAGADAEQELMLDSEAHEALKSVNPCDFVSYTGVHPLLLPGPDRGGPAHRRPGITWRDLDEFDGSSSSPQIFGHSRKSAQVRFTANAVCLDTGAHAFALLEDGQKLRIVSIGDKKIQAVQLPPVDSAYRETAKQQGSFLVRKPDEAGRLIQRGWNFKLNFPGTPSAAKNESAPRSRQAAPSASLFTDDTKNIDDPDPPDFSNDLRRVRRAKGVYGFEWRQDSRTLARLHGCRELLQAILSQAGAYLLTGKFHAFWTFSIGKAEGGFIIPGRGEFIPARDCMVMNPCAARIS